MVKKINWKIANLALWIEIILSYILPFKVVDNFQYKVGVPVPFITIYNTAVGFSPFTSMLLNPVGLLVNIVIIYFILSLCIKTYQKFKADKEK